MKYSKQRELIYNWVANNPVHPTADEVYSNLKKNHPNLSLGTVYRNLNLLAENNKLYKINIANASDRFDACIEPHYHLICQKCGKVHDVFLPEMKTIHQKIEDVTQCSLSCIDVIMHGICKACQEEENLSSLPNS